jgi:hypothetical protein
MTSPSDIITNTIQANLNNLHTALPGIIIAFDPATNKARIQPALNKKFLNDSQGNPLPILENVPVMFPGGGSFNITFPINEGDYVLLIFIERSIDLWKSVGGQVTPNDPRKFNLSDAIAIPGLQPFNGDFSNNISGDFSITYAGSKIIIHANGDIEISTANKVAIGNQVTEVLDAISRLMGLLQGPTVMGAAFGGPLNPAFNAQVLLIQNEIDLLKGTIT